MKLQDAFPSKYMNAADVKFPRTVTVVGVRQEEVGEKKELKWVAYFQGEPKPMILNKTVWTQIALCTSSDDTDGWTGKSVELFQDIVRNPQGQMVPGLRVRTAGTTAIPSQQRPAAMPPQTPAAFVAPQPGGNGFIPPQVQVPTPPWSPEAEAIPDPGQPMTAAQYAAYQQAQQGQKPPF